MFDLEFVTGMSQPRLDAKTVFPYDNTDEYYSSYIASLKRAIISYKAQVPNALIFYGMAYENPAYTKPVDNSMILRIQHGNEYHQFHFHREDCDSFKFWRYRIMSVTRAIDRRTEYSADYARIHMLTRSPGQATYDFLLKYGA